MYKQPAQIAIGRFQWWANTILIAQQQLNAPFFSCHNKMAYKLVLIFISFVLCATAFGQRRIIFKDNFVDNRNYWTIVKDNEFYVNISHHAITFKKKHKNRVNNGCLWYKKTIPKFKSENNFIITFNANILSADDVTDGFDFQWGMIDETGANTQRKTSLYQIDFELTKVRLSKFDNLQGWTYYDWSDNFGSSIDSNFVLKYGTVYRYEIKQIGTMLFVSINNKVVYTIPIVTQKGKNIGVQQCLKSTWRMSKFCIRQK